MARRVICCAGSNGFEYLYVNTSELLVENITDNVANVISDARGRCCLDDLVPFALGEKTLNDQQRELFSFDFYHLNSFELFNNADELRLKTGSETVLHSCLLNYYRREYDGTQQHTFFSEPTVSNTYVKTDGAVEHELTLEEREWVQNDPSKDVELETLDKGKTDAEREAEAAKAQAELEQQEAIADAEAKARKKDKQKQSRDAHRRIMEEERYREFRNQDNVQSAEYQRLRQYEEEMRANNAYLASQYDQGNYASLPGVVDSLSFANQYETGATETLGIAIDNRDLYRLASRMDEFGVPYTVASETLYDGRQISNILYSSEYAEAASSARDFYELERNLVFDEVVPDHNFYNAFQLSALEFGYVNNVDVSYVDSGAYSGNQMFRILDAGLKGDDMATLANPMYSPAHMDALSYCLNKGWDTTPISDPNTTPSALADHLIHTEISNGVPHEQSFFASHDYDSFLSYNVGGNQTGFSNDYDNAQQLKYYRQMESVHRDSERQANFETFKDNLHNAYEQRQREMNYISHSTDGSAPTPSSVSGQPMESGNAGQVMPFGSGYTPTGFVRDDSSFSTFQEANLPFGVAASQNATTPYNNHGSGGPSPTPPSRKMPGGGKFPLDELKVRSDFARKVGLKVQTYGSKCVQSTIGAVQNSFNTVVHSVGQNDDTGAFSSFNTVKRTAGNVFLVAQLVTDVPGSFVRAGQGVSHTANTVMNMGRKIAGKQAVDGRTFKTFTSGKQVQEAVSKLHKEQFNTIKSKYGANAAKMNLREVNSQIKKLSKESLAITQKQTSLKNEINDLSKKKRAGGLTKDEKLLLKQKINTYNDNQTLLRKNKATTDKLNKVKDLKKQGNKALKKLKSAQGRMSRRSTRFRRLPGMLAQSFVSKLQKDGEGLTLSGIASASSFAMKFVRSPVRRLSFKAANFLVVRPTKWVVKKTAKISYKYAVRPVMRVTVKPAARFVGRKVIMPAGRVVGRKVVKPVFRVANKRVIKPVTKGVIKPVYHHVLTPIGHTAVKVWNSKIGRIFRKGTRGTFKVASFAGKIVSAPLRFASKVVGKVFDFFAFLKRLLWKAVLSLAGFILVITILASLVGSVAQAVASVFGGSDTDDDGRMKLQSYIAVVNDAKDTFEDEIRALSLSGDYDNVYYAHVGNGGDNTKQILAMTYARFNEHIEDNRDIVDAYMKQLYADSNYCDYALSEKYKCENGCEERDYDCYDAIKGLNPPATTTRESLFKSSDHSKVDGVVKDEAKGCTKSVEVQEYECCDDLPDTYTQAHLDLYNKYHARGGCKSRVVEKSETTYCGGCTEFEYHGAIYLYCKGHTETRKETEYYCSGHKENIISYSCPGHTEKVCPGEHQDITITITSLGFDGIFSADSSALVKGSIVRGEAYKDKFVVSAYCSCHECCHPYDPACTGKPSKTATGTTPQEGRTIAVDPKVIPLGSKVWIDGHEYVAEDTGDAIKGNRIDMYFESHSAALQWGRRTKTIYKSEVFSGEHKPQRSVVNYKQLAEAAATEQFNAGFVLRAFGKAKSPEVVWMANRVEHDDVDSYTAKLQGFDLEHETEPYSNVELNVLEYVKMPLAQVQAICAERGLNSSGNMYTLITEQLIPYDRAHPSLLVKPSVNTDELYFDGWTDDNKDIARHVYESMVGEEANDVYAGLDTIEGLSYGVGCDTDFDFSGIEFPDESNLTSLQKKLLQVIQSNTVPTEKGMCQAWVAHAYQSAIGGGYSSRCCANHAGEAWGASNDWKNIQVGATVYGYSNSVYGHVGIYIGNGQVAHNIGYVQVQSLESWVYAYNGQCWGWNGGINLSGNGKYNCKPAGTFIQGKD